MTEDRLTEELPAVTSRRSAMFPRYLLPILAVLGGGGGVGGFVGAQAQQEQTRTAVEEIQRDVKGIRDTLSERGTQAALTNQAIQTLRLDLQRVEASGVKLRDEFDATQRRRR